MAFVGETETDGVREVGVQGTVCRGRACIKRWEVHLSWEGVLLVFVEVVELWGNVISGGRRGGERVPSS